MPRARSGTIAPPAAEQWGEFLCGVFDEWVRRDVGRVYVQYFDVALEAWAGITPSLCVHAPTCGNCLALEHNGDLFTCNGGCPKDRFIRTLDGEPGLSYLCAGYKRQKNGQMAWTSPVFLNYR